VISLLLISNDYKNNLVYRYARGMISIKPAPPGDAGGRQPGAGHPARLSLFAIRE
jgi:hypothetical protein